MPHQVGAQWSGAAGLITVLGLLATQGCSPGDSTLLVIVTHGAGHAVVASPIDPRTLRAAAPRSTDSGPLAKSIARYYAVADSADSLDQAFQHTRDTLNNEARRMATADKRAAAYGREYDAFMRRVGVATRTREARDRARRRAASLRAELGARVPDRPGRSAALAPLRPALDSAAQARGRPLQRVLLRDRQARLDLEPGIWWIAVEHEGGLLGGVRRHEARAKTPDTLRIGS